MRELQQKIVELNKHLTSIQQDVVGGQLTIETLTEEQQTQLSNAIDQFEQQLQSLNI